MKYNNSWLINKYNNGDHINFIFFWGHQPSKNGEITKSCLSQWFESEFEYIGEKYKTAEHWMMACKAILFGDSSTFEKILNCNHPSSCKDEGRKIKNFNEIKWEAHKFEIVKNGNFLKFDQNLELKKYLQSTGDKILVEASPYDKIWGIGLRDQDPDVINPTLWQGQNLLGYALMEVRDMLK